MLIPLSKVKIGDEVIVYQFGEAIRGHVVAYDKDDDLSMMAWEKGIAEKAKYSSWPIRSQERNKYPNIPEAFTNGWWLPSIAMCKVVSSNKTRSVGFLAMCIAAGAGMSTYASKSSNKRANNLNHKASRI